MRPTTSERSDNLSEVEPPAERWNLLDHPAWAWVAAARLIDQPRFSERWLEGLEPPTEWVGFSTFLPGQEPDVWPALETETAAPWGWAAAGGLVALALLALFTPALVRAGVRS